MLWKKFWFRFYYKTQKLNVNDESKPKTRDNDFQKLNKRI